MFGQISIDGIINTEKFSHPVLSKICFMDAKADLLSYALFQQREYGLLIAINIFCFRQNNEVPRLRQKAKIQLSDVHC